MLTWHLPHYYFTLYRPKHELMHLFWGGVLRRMAILALALFSPIYIYQTFRDFGFTFKLAILLLIGFYILEQIAKLTGLGLAEDLSRKVGFKGTIRLSALPFLGFILSLIFARESILLFLPAALLAGIHSGFYWWGYHGYFIKTGDARHFGVSVSEASLLETVASVITPFIGGIITKFLGFPTLFAFSTLLIFISLLFFGKGHDTSQKLDIKFKEVLSLIKDHTRASLAYWGSSGETILYLVVWPLFLYLFFGTVVSLGAIVSLAALVAGVFALAVGEWVDKQGERKVIRLGAPLVFISWIIKAIERSFSAYVFADSFWNFGQRMVTLPLNSLSYRKALEGGSTARAVFFREANLVIGAILSLTILALTVVVTNGLSAIFWMAAVFSLFPMLSALTYKNG